MERLGEEDGLALQGQRQPGARLAAAPAEEENEYFILIVASRVRLLAVVQAGGDCDVPFWTYRLRWLRIVSYGPSYTCTLLQFLGLYINCGLPSMPTICV